MISWLTRAGILAAALATVSAFSGDSRVWTNIGATDVATIAIDAADPLLQRDEDGNLVAQLSIRIRLNTPARGVKTVENRVTLACVDGSGLVSASKGYDSFGRPVFDRELNETILWVKGDKSTTDLVMTKLCSGEKVVKK